MIADEDEEGGGGGDMWLVSYADLMTLLFAAFVVLYGLKSEGETREIRGIVSSIRESFVEIPDQIKDPDSGPSHDGRFVFKYMRLNQRKERVIKTFKRNDHYVNAVDKDLEVLNKSIETALNEKIGKRFNKKSRNVTVHKDGKNLVISIAATVLFDSGSYRLKRRQLINMDPIAKFLRDIDRDIIIQAYAPVEKTNKENSGLNLASLRASYLGRYFTSKHEVPIHRVRLNGFSLNRDKMNLNSETIKKLENRIDVKIIYE